jgi:type VI secretion system protein ImpH
MTDRDRMQAEPWAFDFLGTMRRLERSDPERPRIGENATLADEIVRLGQDPYLEFPASNLSQVTPLDNGRLAVLVRFLGLMGPQGALPLATTEEALGWLESQHDEAFPRFLDILNNRFLQLFFRVWADARPIAQNDRPDRDRFKTYVGATVGIGTEAMQQLDTIPDAGKFNFAGIAACQTKSASRLRALIRGLFGVKVEIDEFVGSRLALETAEQSALGTANSRLGDDMILGGSCFSVEDKFRVRIFVRDMAQYVRFLPTGDRCEPLVDLVFYFAGEALDWEVELALPTAEVAPMRLGSFGQVGWTTWLAPNWASTEPYRCDARFHPASLLRERRQRAA